MSAAPAPLEAPAWAASFGPAEFQAATGASGAHMADLETFRLLLTDWNERMNLVGPSALAEFWLRHAFDSAQLLSRSPDAKIWADLGAGAGFPGLVLALLMKGREGTEVHLVESMAKRCRFLEAVAEATGAPVQIHNARAEELSLKVEVVTARACAPMVKLLGYAWPYFRKGATGLFLKGQDVEIELNEATRYWKFKANLSPSLSSPQGRIVHMRGLSRA